jgi:hypothetical protein
MEKREKIKKYFREDIFKAKPEYGATVIPFMGAGLFLLSFYLITIKTGPGILVLLISICLIISGLIQYSINSSRPSDSQMDEWLEEDIKAIIKNRPYDKLGISKADLVAETLLVVGPVYWNVSGFDVKDIMMKKGKDGFNRFSIWTIQVFMFTENYLCSYKCQYNWIKNTYINESTNEFFYKDVVSVKTDTISSAYTLMNGQRMVHSEAFQLKLAGDEITVITNDASLNTSSVMVSKAEKAVQSIRTMLRDKKK